MVCGTYLLVVCFYTSASYIIVLWFSPYWVEVFDLTGFNRFVSFLNVMNRNSFDRFSCLSNGYWLNQGSSNITPAKLIDQCSNASSYVQNKLLLSAKRHLNTHRSFTWPSSITQSRTVIQLSLYHCLGISLLVPTRKYYRLFIGDSIMSYKLWDAFSHC